MLEAKRGARTRPQRSIHLFLLEEALATWLLPTIGAAMLALAMLLDALGLMADPPTALLAVLGLLVLGASTVLGPLLGESHAARTSSALLIAATIAWITIFTTPFALRLFPGAPVATASLESEHTGEGLTLGSGRFDLVLDAHLPPALDRQNRQLYYALTLTDGAGTSQRLAGELGDRWQTRRLGRRGTAPVHLEHLSASHPIDDPAGGSLRIDDVTLSGVPNATLSGAFYRHRVPRGVWLLLGGISLAIGALAFDLWSHPQRTPAATLVTATATGAMLVFCNSAAGHLGLRQVFGSTIIGGLGGVPTAGLAAWLAQRSSWIRARTSQRAS
ncbi:MAG: hypothetical protein IT293_21710 [Deltaproteobacteria bacterium]|nr:hypothetical protein [Deltaproteobacteria bacterium]